MNNADDPKDDGFRPPKEPTEVVCLHCGSVYPSSEIVFEVRPGAARAFWHCAIRECEGAGYGCDLFATSSELGAEMVKQFRRRRKAKRWKPALRRGRDENVKKTRGRRRTH